MNYKCTSSILFSHRRNWTLKDLVYYYRVLQSLSSLQKTDRVIPRATEPGAGSGDYGERKTWNQRY
jgi:hypothetical protein